MGEVGERNPGGVQLEVGSNRDAVCVGVGRRLRSLVAILVAILVLAGLTWLVCDRSLVGRESRVGVAFDGRGRRTANDDGVSSGLWLQLLRLLGGWRLGAEWLLGCQVIRSCFELKVGVDLVCLAAGRQAAEQPRHSDGPCGKWSQ